MGRGKRAAREEKTGTFEEGGVGKLLRLGSELEELNPRTLDVVITRLAISLRLLRGCKQR